MDTSSAAYQLHLLARSDLFCGRKARYRADGPVFPGGGGRNYVQPHPARAGSCAGHAPITQTRSWHSLDRLCPGPEQFVIDYERPVQQPAFVAGAQIEVSGPGGIRNVTTDLSGLYDLDGLAPGDYTLHLLVPDTLAVGSYDGE